MSVLLKMVVKIRDPFGVSCFLGHTKSHSRLRMFAYRIGLRMKKYAEHFSKKTMIISDLKEAKRRHFGQQFIRLIRR